MNCRPGDLARVLSPGLTAQCTCGRTALLIRPDTMVVCETLEADLSWTLRDPLIARAELPCGLRIAQRILAIPDFALRPIRDPGDDAVDEMVQKVGPAPMTAHELLAWSEA